MLSTVHFFRSSRRPSRRFLSVGSTTPLPGLSETEQGDALQSRRKRKTEWKRRQRDQSFLDHVVVDVRGGTGGNGCVAFHREKFQVFGPPSGGNGGRGGDVYILPTPHLTTLSSIPKRIRAESGANGQGTWRNGRNGAPLVIQVPLGTEVKELTGDDMKRNTDAWAAEEWGLEGLDPEEKRLRMRQSRWLHYPNREEDNVQTEGFKEAEAALYRQERELRIARRKRAQQPIHLDLDKVEDCTLPSDAPLGTKPQGYLGHRVAHGGPGGLGNPHFVSATNRSPKFATRGQKGERITLSLELKLLADIGLVGMPNSGKSTLLRALTGGRARSEVAGYAFTTLNPVVGVVRVADDGTWEGALNAVVYDETRMEEQRTREEMARGEYSIALTRHESPPAVARRPRSTDQETYSLGRASSNRRAGHLFDLTESFRFTIADNPGLISGASQNKGLGHSFLRSIERSLALAYVVDLSGPAPWDDLRILREELEKYKPGLSTKARMVIANKADLLQAHDHSTEQEAKEKLRLLEAFVHKEKVFLDDSVLYPPTRKALDVVPTSAKFSQNLQRVVNLLKTYVEDYRTGAFSHEDCHKP